MRREMARRVVEWALMGTVATSLGTPGCSSDKSEHVNLELISWWTSDDERAALKALTDLNRQRHPDVEVTNLFDGGGMSHAHDMIQSKLAYARPNTFQANVGNDLLQWVAANELEPLPPQISQLPFAPKLRDNASFGSVMYGVPLNVHRINSLFYDQKFFEENQLETPKSVQEFRTLCPVIDQLGRTCLAVGDFSDDDNPPWVLAQILFEMILPGIGGKDYYERFWNGGADPDSDEVLEQALELMLFLRCGPTPNAGCDKGYINSDVDGLRWYQAVPRMIAPGENGERRAAMIPHGDWAKGNLGAGCLEPDSGKPCWHPDEDFRVVPFPSDAEPNLFVYTADTFPSPRMIDHRKETIDLLETFASVEGQIAFNRVKGSIPARTGLTGKLDSMCDQVIDEFDRAYAADTLATARTGLQKPNTLENLNLIVKNSLAAGTILPIRQYLSANYGMLKGSSSSSSTP
jgi:glucose/mannose transport system substrate-binding protein